MAPTGKRKSPYRSQSPLARVPNWVKWATAGAVLALLVSVWFLTSARPARSTTPSPETQALVRQVERLHRDLELDRGIELVKAQLAKEPNGPLLHYLLGVLYGAKGDYATAVSELQEEIKLNPGLGPAHKQLGINYSRRGEMDLAILQLQKAIQLEPNDLDAHFQLGLALTNAGRFAEAEKPLLQASQKKDELVLATLGNVYRNLDQDAKASEALRAALSVNPNNAAAILNLGQVLQRLGQKEQGEQLLRRHEELSYINDQIDNGKQKIRLDPGNGRHHLALAEDYVQAENSALAIASCQRALELDPKLVEAALKLFSLFVQTDQFDKTNQLAVQTFQNNPGNPIAVFLVGLNRIVNPQDESPAKPFEISKRAWAWDSEAYRMLGEAYLKRNEFAQSEAAFAQSIALDPKSKGYFGLALSQYQRDNLPAAKLTLQRGLQNGQQNGDLHMLLGIVNFRLKEEAVAARNFNEAIKIQRTRLFDQAATDRMLKRFSSLPQSQLALANYRQQAGS